ncbi:MAG: T9SS type A sorting domain-containing protein [Sphingobacteriales bacterium]|nr:MAG: T9SS type A sorting domain-containing protein [Sphingobacteriales bacterium]
MTLNFYDLTGRLLFEKNLQPTFGTNNYVLDMLPYPQGLYVVTLNNEIEVVSGKVVKE